MLLFSFSVNKTFNDSYNNSYILFEYKPSVRIAFYTGEIISIICIIFGILGNLALIFAIYRSSFCRFSYGLLLLFISIFDIIRLISAAFYYFIQARIVSLNLTTITISIMTVRYPKNVTNWLKVFLAIERLITMRYWITNRFNVNTKNTTKIQRSKQRKILLLIFLLLICSLISQHPSLITNRYISVRINPISLFFDSIPNPKFYYGYQKYNAALFTIISSIILDDILPITTLIIINTILLYKLKHLPLITRKKIAESIWILFFLTIFSLFLAPRSFNVFLNLYVDQKYVNNTNNAIVFHIFQGLELINHAVTGYACFLSCQKLRETFLEFLRTIYKKFENKTQTKDNLSISHTVNSPVGFSQRL